MMPGSGFDGFMFSAVPAFMTIIFIIIFAIVIFTIFKGLKTWNYNNAQPVLTVIAKIVAKRVNVSESMHNNDNNMSHSTTSTYYVTFEVESGDRMEFIVSGNEYGMLVEGDEGKLTFQGSRYKGFIRNINK
ncbi:DUF2500 domain-containing protein [Clostridium sp. YIM B02515]|uniref:DUF2500 domain-containing protein n=1 Tax=Clostridium rhizosphaerae TaxID=2803861 RepID=A0ABS1TD90_9CLOT|nr:DUF2500 domain-containing protein [Clostridium rhizosphaerae]MBL4937318.1 DUF2500 domain-containing protein [Clostridium rhizosphaerae]